MHLAGTEKSQVWPNSDRALLYTQGAAGKVTEQPCLQSGRVRISSLNLKIIVLS
jgi:hypothetical protein